MRAFAVAALLALLTSGCAYTGPIAGNESNLKGWAPSFVPFSSPSQNQVHKVKIGTTLVKQGAMKSTPTIILEENFVSQWPLAGEPWTVELAYPEGAVLKKRAVAADGTVIYTNNFMQKSEHLNYGYMSILLGYEIGLGVSDSGDVSYVAIRRDPRIRLDIRSETPPKPLKFSRHVIDHVNEQNFRQEFIYSGRNDSELFFLYREFSGDMLRPAFNQNVTYAVTGPRTLVAFRNLTIEVIDATNLDITYQILSPF